MGSGAAWSGGACATEDSVLAGRSGYRLLRAPVDGDGGETRLGAAGLAEAERREVEAIDRLVGLAAEAGGEQVAGDG
jgi:hypothetical protein